MDEKPDEQWWLPWHWPRWVLLASLAIWLGGVLATLLLIERLLIKTDIG